MTINELEKAWNAEQRENAWEELGLDEIVAFAQELERERLAGMIESLVIDYRKADSTGWCAEMIRKNFK